MRIVTFKKCFFLDFLEMGKMYKFCGYAFLKCLKCEKGIVYENKLSWFSLIHTTNVEQGTLLKVFRKEWHKRSIHNTRILLYHVELQCL